MRNLPNAFTTCWNSVNVRSEGYLLPFFSPDQISICEQILGKQVYYKIDGGYDGAERCRIAILPYEEDADMKITCLKSNLFFTICNLSHRDLLGAY